MMDSDSSSKFIGSLTKFLQSLCNGYVEFQRGVELVGHIYLSIDTGEKVDYILHERVSKNDENSVTFVSNSFHAQPHDKEKTSENKDSSSKTGAVVKSKDTSDDDDIVIVDQSKGVPGSSNTGTIPSRGVKRSGSPNSSDRHMQRMRGAGGPSGPSRGSSSFHQNNRQHSGPSATVTSQSGGQRESLNISDVKLEQISKDELMSLASQVGSEGGSRPSHGTASAAAHSHSPRSEGAMWIKQEAADDDDGGGNETGWSHGREDSNSNSGSNLYPVMLHQNPAAYSGSTFPGFSGPGSSGSQSAANPYADPLPGTSQDSSGLDPSDQDKKPGKKRKGPYITYHVSVLQQALDAINAGKLSFGAAAVKFGIPKSTLVDHIHGRSHIGGKAGRKPSIPPSVENEIVDKAVAVAKAGFPLTKRQFLWKIKSTVKKLNLKTQFKNQAPGDEYFRGLKKRRPDLVIRKPECAGNNKKGMDSTINRFFDNLEQIVSINKLTGNPAVIWNVDEIVAQFSSGHAKILEKKRSKQQQTGSTDLKEAMTTVVCASGSGKAMPPLFVTSDRTVESYAVHETPAGLVWTHQDNAGLGSVVGAEWFCDVFLRHCGPERPQLLILDASSDVIDFLDLARKENIQILSVPTKMSGILQPLERIILGPFRRVLAELCVRLMPDSSHCVINETMWPVIVRQLWEEVITPELLQNAFEASGIIPVNRSRISLEALVPPAKVDQRGERKATPPARYDPQIVALVDVEKVAQKIISAGEDVRSVIPSGEIDLNAMPARSNVKNVPIGDMQPEETPKTASLDSHAPQDSVYLSENQNMTLTSFSEAGLSVLHEDNVTSQPVTTEIADIGGLVIEVEGGDSVYVDLSALTSDDKP